MRFSITATFGLVLMGCVDGSSSGATASDAAAKQDGGLSGGELTDGATVADGAMSDASVADAAPGCDLSIDDVVGDGNDQNCDGVDGVDADQDGVASEASGGLDCDDTDPAVFPGSAENWIFEIIDLPLEGECESCRKLAWPDDLVIDEAGAAHISFGLPGNAYSDKHPVHATNETGSWVHSVISSRHVLGLTSTRLALGPDSTVYLTYVNSGLYIVGTAVWVATLAPDGSWSRDILGGDQYPDIAVDEAGFIHLATANLQQTAESMPERYSNKIIYTSNATGDWESVEPSIDGATSRIAGTAIVVSSTGQPHIIWYDKGETQQRAGAPTDFADPQLRHWTTYDGSPVGVTVTVDIDGIAPRPHMAIDGNDVLYASYWAGLVDSESKELRLAKYQDSSWSFEAVLTSMTAVSARVAVTAAGAVTLCYSGDGAVEVVSNELGTWQRESVLAGATSCAVALDSAGAVHLAFAQSRDAGHMIHAFRGASPGIDKDCNGRDD